MTFLRFSDIKNFREALEIRSIPFSTENTEEIWRAVQNEELSFLIIDNVVCVVQTCLKVSIKGEVLEFYNAGYVESYGFLKNWYKQKYGFTPCLVDHGSAKSTEFYKGLTLQKTIHRFDLGG